MFEDTTTVDSIVFEPPAVKPSRKRNAVASATEVVAAPRRPKRPILRPAEPVTTAIKRKSPSKSALVLKLLARTKGATIVEMAEPTGWQPHSTRAFLSGLRKKGTAVTREQRRTGETAYRIGAVSVAENPAVTPVGDASSATSDEGISGVGIYNFFADATASVEVGAASVPEAAA